MLARRGYPQSTAFAVVKAELGAAEDLGAAGMDAGPAD
ncbi:Uncharacterised protein [Mycobacteroides abscessus subsp. abscessus]|nr:Uncharacterised protein [Mycobacteroides abscessus subsp. abscessus]